MKSLVWCASLVAVAFLIPSAAFGTIEFAGGYTDPPNTEGSGYADGDWIWAGAGASAGGSTTSGSAWLNFWNVCYTTEAGWFSAEFGWSGGATASQTNESGEFVTTSAMAEFFVDYPQGLQDPYLLTWEANASGTVTKSDTDPRSGEGGTDSLGVGWCGLYDGVSCQGFAGASVVIPEGGGDEADAMAAASCSCTLYPWP